MNVRPFSPGDGAAVIDLVLTIQREEFGMTITAQDQPDLVAIPTHYQRGSGNFWIAEEDGEIVGSVGMLDIGNGQGALRKMFVKKEARGGDRAVASRLLKELVRWAADQDVAHIFLGTTAWFHAAHRFYERHGFEQVERVALPESFPVMKVDTRFYRLDVEHGGPARE